MIKQKRKQDRKRKNWKEIADKVLRVFMYLALFYFIIQEKNILSGAGWVLMIMSEIMNYVPDIQKMRYKSGKILTMGVWILGLTIYLVFWR